VAQEQKATKASQPTTEKRGGYQSGPRPASQLKPPPKALTKPKPASGNQGGSAKK